MTNTNGPKDLDIGDNLVVDQADADQLAAAGIELAYLFDQGMPNGNHWILTVAVN